MKKKKIDINELTQEVNVLNHLYRYGDITKSYALSVFGVQNLMEVIRRLRKKGYRIATEYFSQENGKKIVIYCSHKSDIESAWRG